MSVHEWLVICAIALAVAALVVAILALRTIRWRTGAVATTVAPSAPVATNQHDDRYAFVVNASKPGARALRTQIEAIFMGRGMAAPLWFETTAEDPGTGQTKTALDQGATVVVAGGGDGTVRAVAEVLAGTSATMGILPLGTGNLLARNLDIDVTDADLALSIIMGEHTRRIDVGRIQLLEPTDEAPTSPHLFLVIGGIGFDAAMVADTDLGLKARVGWMAYFMAGARHIHARRMGLTITIDDRPAVTTKLRTFLVGNCGRLPGGLTLLPEALIDDGILDLAALDARGGVVGWVQLFGEVVMQGIGLRNDLPNKIGRIDHTSGVRVTAWADRPQRVQIDGEVLGEALGLEAWVDPGVLAVRAPVPRLITRASR